ncbi:hypothetical protein B0T25DRAFT_523544 [Lasiosphaeria hispida]|uniref:Uncharacterized protein n=1 Tax=Lasiosphaeria hispida TaxID=260671 RepID=A0AAJ0H5S8_9PEZI|nr:hypothetical protein B0T25DRAFT_523544 [Lasiosphaeria hispida]
MRPSALAIPCLWAAGFKLVSAGPSPAAPALRARDAPGMSTGQTLKHLAQSLNAVRIEGRDTSFTSNKTVLDTTWSGATLLKQGPSGERRRATAEGAFDVEIVCQKCYIKGAASASLTVKGDIGDAISNYTTEVMRDVLNVTEVVFDAVGDTILNVLGDVFTLAVFEDDYDVEFPTVDVDFDLDLKPLPGVSVKFQFEDGFELYMLLNTKLGAGATYTLNLYASKSPLGFAIGSDITAGVAVVIDLILDVSTAIDMSSGFHLRLDKGVGFELNMFSQNVSNVAFPGGQFEFLPVSIVSPGVVLKGILRVGLKLGLELDTGGIAPILDNTPFNIKAGIVAEVFANVAEFITNVTGPAPAPKNSKPATNPCDLNVIEAYQFALGAAAGATVAVGFQTWGPIASESTPLFYTTLASACAIRKPLPPTAPPAPPGPTTPSLTRAATTTSGGGGLFGRQASLTTTTTTTTVVFTGESCKSSGLINCPASLQVSSTYKSTMTLITALPLGAEPTFPITRVASVESPVAFGGGVREMVSSSGVPTSFVPGPTGAAGAVKGWLEGSTGGLGNKVLLGLVVGLGVPLLAGIVMY